jgi:hypothetical protein
MKKKCMKTLKLNKELISNNLNSIVGGIDKRKVKIPGTGTINTHCCADTVNDGSCGCGVA